MLRLWREGGRVFAVWREGGCPRAPRRLRTPEKCGSGLTSLQALGPQPNAGLKACASFFAIVDGVLRTPGLPRAAALALSAKERPPDVNRCSVTPLIHRSRFAFTIHQTRLTGHCLATHGGRDPAMDDRVVRGEPGGATGTAGVIGILLGARDADGVNAATLQASSVHYGHPSRTTRIRFAPPVSSSHHEYQVRTTSINFAPRVSSSHHPYRVRTTSIQFAPPLSSSPHQYQVRITRFAFAPGRP
jgi:hypothetical protein